MKRIIFIFLIFTLAGLVVETDPDFEVPITKIGEFNSKEVVANREVFRPKPTLATLTRSEPVFSSMIFVGDVFLGRNLEYLMNQHGCDYPFKKFDLTELSKSPAIIANFEAAVPEVHQPTPIKQLKFSVQKSCLDTVRKFGFSHFSLANNHSLDFGEDGLRDTEVALAESGLKSFGFVGKSLAKISYIDLDSQRVAVIGFERLSSRTSKNVMRNVLDAASLRSDKQVVYIHWGDEYQLKSNQAQRDLAEELVSAGADLIIGHHPHVVQEIDVIGNVPVFYSLGNYIFDQYFSEEVQQSLVLQLDFTDDHIYLIPASSEDSLSQPQMMTPSEHMRFLSNLADRSNSQLRDQILKGVIVLNSKVATSPKVAMMSGVKR